MKITCNRSNTVKDGFWGRLPSVLFYGTCLGSTTLWAAPDLPPIGDQVLRTGHLFSMLISADDPTGQIPLLTSDTLPGDAVLLENLDGSRTFMWVPDDKDIGDHTLIIRAVDPGDPQVPLEQTVKLTIANDENYQQLKQQSALAETPTVAPAMDTLTPTETPPTPLYLNIDDELTASFNTLFEYTFDLSGQTEHRYRVRLLNQPADMQFIENANTSYSIAWQPTPAEAGTTILIFQVMDTMKNEVATSRRVRLVVRAQDHP